MTIEAALLNVPKWLLDKRALNQPVLPLQGVPEPIYQPYTAEMVDTLSGRIHSLNLADTNDAYKFGVKYSAINPFSGMWPGRPLVWETDEDVGPPTTKLSLTGPGIVNFLGLTCQSETTANSTSYRYRLAARVAVDGQDLYSERPEVRAGGTNGSYYYSSVPLVGSVNGTPPPVPIYFKNTFEVELEVSQRDTSSTRNCWMLFGDWQLIK